MFSGIGLRWDHRNLELGTLTRGNFDSLLVEFQTGGIFSKGSRFGKEVFLGIGIGDDGHTNIVQNLVRNNRVTIVGNGQSMRFDEVGSVVEADTTRADVNGFLDGIVNYNNKWISDFFMSIYITKYLYYSIIFLFLFIRAIYYLEQDQRLDDKENRHYLHH